MVQIHLPALRVFLRENTSESERVTVSSKLRQLILVLNNITLFKPIICHVCGANCVDVIVLILFLSSTFFSSSSLKCFFNSLFGNFFYLKMQRKCNNSDSIDSISMFQHSSTNIMQFNSESECSYVQLWRQYIYLYIYFFPNRWTPA